MHRNQTTFKRRLLFFGAFAGAVVLIFGVKIQPSAARPLPINFDSYVGAPLDDSLLYRLIAQPRTLNSDARPQNSMTFTNPRLLVSTPKTDAMPLSGEVQKLLIRTEFRVRREVTVPSPSLRFSSALPAGTRRLLKPGSPSVAAVTERVTSWNNLVVERRVVARETLQAGRPAIMLAAPPRTITEAMKLTGARKLVAVYHMVATAYTADSARGIPSGRTASGLPARYGVVAVDPHVIPLGTQLYVEGYGTAIAADTGSAIVGHRIDLCMDSLQRAIDWGRQPVRVYVLRNR